MEEASSSNALRAAIVAAIAIADQQGRLLVGALLAEALDALGPR